MLISVVFPDTGKFAHAAQPVWEYWGLRINRPLYAIHKIS